MTLTIDARPSSSLSTRRHATRGFTVVEVRARVGTPQPCLAGLRTVAAWIAGGFKIVDANKQTLAYVYGHADPRDAGTPTRLLLVRRDA